VTLTTLDHLGAGVGDALPVDAVSDDLSSNDLLAGVEIQATNHVELVTDGRHGRTLPWRWHPSRVLDVLDIDSVALSLLHPLNVGLQASNQLVDESVPWDVLSRRSCEFFLVIIVVGGVIFDHKPWLRSVILDSSGDELGLGVIGEEPALVGTVHHGVRLLVHALLSGLTTVEEATAEALLGVHHGITDRAAGMKMVESINLKLLWRVLKNVELVLHRTKSVRRFNDERALSSGLASGCDELAMPSIGKLVPVHVRLPTTDHVVVI